MKKALGFIIAIFIIITIAGCTKAPVKIAPVDDKSEIAKLMQAKFKAYNEKNVDKYSDCFDPASNDIGSIQTSMQKLFKEYDCKLEQIGYVVVTNVTDDTAEAQYAQKLVVTKGKGLENNTIKAVDQLRKVKGKWKIVTTQITDQYSFPGQ